MSDSPRPTSTGQLVVTQKDLDDMAHHTLVSHEHQLVLFTIPKVGSTELIKLMRRMTGAADWQEDPHYQPDRPFLRDLGLHRVQAILSDSSWTKAVVLRDPAERLLSAYLDKFCGPPSYAANLFRPNGAGMSFEEFISYVLDENTDPARPTGLHPTTDPHWRPQRWVGPIERFLPAIDTPGSFDHLRPWIERVLRTVSGWGEFGATGWGPRGQAALFDRNDSTHRTGSADRMTDYYDAATLEAVYRAYASDLALAERLGIDIRRWSGTRGAVERKPPVSPPESRSSSGPRTSQF